MSESINRGAYRKQLFRKVPMYTTKLVREGEFTFTQRDQVENPGEVATILREYFRDKDREEFVIVLLDTANTLIGLSSISVGGLASSIVEPRQVFKVAALANAAGIIAAHNHLSGNPTPSADDVKITKQLAAVGKLMNIPLLDHIIVCETYHVSLAERGLI